MTKTGFEVLQTAGLTGNETKVFLKLLESGTTTPGDLIVKTGLHRSRVYDCLNKLIQLGLVSYVVQDNKKFVRAEDTSKLLDLLEAREKELKRQKKELSQAISSLESKRGKQRAEQEVAVFRGRNGIKSVLADWLKEGREVLVIGAYGEHAETLDYYLKYVLPGFHKERIAARIPFK
ncbi:MAG: helix-turn-helix domain-containing protein, partial [Candidatus Micrarchaeota archaeon]